ncbi:Uncharacterised protein [Vibrio cholerae]|uniref:Uncharacterized protein n=1 Tax=Vibrio cholerae TaxID=666 RepID=A0A656AX77_VIBCL|nr:Uncharacterised protein [Vibrio cholerae]CSC05802.1 Uncharacterised protein [Vibrio cholerae]CSC28001.1 Uncharacterised protein [Vibrio cholerae]CSC38474.1 Uncharacterised protein [Vibrio cholerae]CSD48312.1 Uncharacterised protein [Vibrio cholerae]
MPQIALSAPLMLSVPHLNTETTTLHLHLFFRKFVRLASLSALLIPTALTSQ